MSKAILKKPKLSEKSNDLSSTQNTYVFLTSVNANKIEIKSAVETQFGVRVESVRTLINATKPKNRFTKSGMIRGRSERTKKAYVKLIEGDFIDVYGAAETEEQTVEAKA